MMTDFEELRAEIYTIHRNENLLLRQWIKEAGVDAIMVTRDRNVWIIHTTRPGLLIGYHGELISKYKELFKQQFGYELTIKFNEIHGDCIVCGES